MEEKKLEGKPVKGVFTVRKANLYKSHMIYIRQFQKYYFEYLLEYNGEIYSSYIIIKPENSRRKLTDKEISEAVGLIYNGATTTLDMLLGHYVSEEDKKTAELFEESRESYESENNGETK